jgi:hypothetical protein
MFKARSENCGNDLYKWSIESNNWVVNVRLNNANVPSSTPDGNARPAFAENLHTLEHDGAWLSHVYKVLTEHDCYFEETPVIFSGFLPNSQCIDDIKPRATIGVFAVFYEKASTMFTQIHAMFVNKRAIEFVKILIRLQS